MPSPRWVPGEKAHAKSKDAGILTMRTPTKLAARRTAENNGNDARFFPTATAYFTEFAKAAPTILEEGPTSGRHRNPPNHKTVQRIDNLCRSRAPTVPNARCHELQIRRESEVSILSRRSDCI